MATASPSARPRGRTRYRRRLRSRIILGYVLLGFSLTLLLAFATNWVRDKVEDELVTDVMNRNIDEVARQYARNPTEEPAIPVQQFLARVVTPDKFDKLREQRPEWYELGDGIHTVRGENDDGTPFAYRLAVRKTKDAWFFLAYDLSESDRGKGRFNQLLVIVIVFCTVLSFLLGWWSAARVMSPVLELARRLKRSHTGLTEALANDFADDEVGQLASALDDYSARLTYVVQRDREFNADVSHELRTPLAVIRGAIELLLARPDTDEKTRNRLMRIQRAEQQCTDLISALLLLSRNERGQGTTDVVRVIDQTLDAHRAQLGGKPVVLRREDGRGLVVDAPEAAVTVALNNLIGNAVKYTAEGEVLVRVHPRSVEVIDSGPGLSPEDAARLFERGYRGTHAGHSQGGGIGLSIVRRLCELYGWEVQVKPGVERGVVATLTFG
ncbi:sensor histidine kinase [Lysobacter xanthus]